ncbi:serpin 1, partial [Aphelenchoides avenae]
MTHLDDFSPIYRCNKEIHKHFGAVVQQLSAEHKNYTLEAANRVYVLEGFFVLDAFKDIIGRHYLGQFQHLDFKENVKAAKEINDFVEKKTHEKIKDLIPADALDEMTRLVLVNAIYFKGTWEKKFNKDFTMKKPFYFADGSEKE